MNEPNEIDLAMKDFIAEVQKDFTHEVEPEPALPVTETKEVVSEQPNTAEPQVPVTDPAERGLERLVAREMELREREAGLSRAQKEVETMRARISELERGQVSEELLNQIKLSPAQGLRALGLDPDEVVRAALVEKLGDKAEDPQIKEMMERSRLRREMEALKAQIQEGERQRAAQEYFNKVQTGANEYVRNIEGLSKHAPTVASVAKTNPDSVFAEIMEEITKDAAVRAVREPNGDVITYEEAAGRVEKRWAAMRTLLGIAPTTPAPGIPASTPTPKTTSVANEAPKPPPTTIKPPEKPMAPWLQRKVDEDEAIRLALAEWSRVESLK